MNTLQDGLREEQKDFLWRMYGESRTHLRHYQSQRATASNIILVTSIGLIGLIARKPLSCNDWPLTCGLIVIGAYGTLFMANHFECIDRCKNRAAKYLKDLKALINIAESSNSNDNPKGEETPVEGECEDDQGLPKLWALRSPGKFRVLWPLTITLIGMIATGYIFTCLC